MGPDKADEAHEVGSDRPHLPPFVCGCGDRFCFGETDPLPCFLYAWRRNPLFLRGSDPKPRWEDEKDHATKLRLMADEGLRLSIKKVYEGSWEGEWLSAYFGCYSVEYGERDTVASFCEICGAKGISSDFVWIVKDPATAFTRPYHGWRYAQDDELYFHYLNRNMMARYSCNKCVGKCIFNNERHFEDSKYKEFFEVPCRSKWVQCQRFEFFIQARRDRGLDKDDDLMAASIGPPGLDGKYQERQFLDPELPD